MTQNKNLTNAQVSKVISQMWKNEKKEIILYWEKLADSMKLKHMQKYPNYVYKPKKRTKDTSKNSSKMISAKTSSTLPPPREESIINQIPYQTYSNDISYFNDIPTYFNELYYTL
ncbi:1447_t:CDS:1, partial [Dentiscutata erythropus]